jgi:hypothetical protein
MICLDELITSAILQGSRIQRWEARYIDHSDVKNDPLIHVSPIGAGAYIQQIRPVKKNGVRNAYITYGCDISKDLN